MFEASLLIPSYIESDFHRLVMQIGEGIMLDAICECVCWMMLGRD